MTEEIELVAELDTAARYSAGLPMIVALQLQNVLEGSVRFQLPALEVWSGTSPVAFLLTHEGASVPEALPHEHAHSHEEGVETGFALQAPEPRRMLFDLSALKSEWVPGRYTLQGSYHTPMGGVVVPPRTFVVERARGEVQEAATQLLARNISGERSWRAFLLQNFREVKSDELVAFRGAEAEQLAFHLFVHRAVYGAAPLALRPVDQVPPLPPGALTGQSAVLRHELLCAHADPSAPALAADIVAAWPGLAFRCDDNRHGRGLLNMLRKLVGAERKTPPLPTPLPYAENAAEQTP